MARAHCNMVVYRIGPLAQVTALVAVLTLVSITISSTSLKFNLQHPYRHESTTCWWQLSDNGGGGGSGKDGTGGSGDADCLQRGCSAAAQCGGGGGGGVALEQVTLE